MPLTHDFKETVRALNAIRISAMLSCVTPSSASSTAIGKPARQYSATM
jgi:hypothetical protein